MTPLADLIRLHRERLGLTKEELANRIGVSRGSVSQWELGLTTPKRNREEDVARALGLSAAELFRTEEPDLVVTVRDPATGERSAVAVELKAHPGGTILRVPRLANQASAGPGDDPLHEDVVLGSLDLSAAWVSQRIRPSSPSALRVITALGDSMSPTFGDGDLLLVDTGIREVRIDGVYALRAFGRLFVKRVRQKLDGAFVVSSDNPAEKTVDELNGSSQIEVLGRIVWAWNGRKL